MAGGAIDRGGPKGPTHPGRGLVDPEGQAAGIRHRRPGNRRRLVQHHSSLGHSRLAAEWHSMRQRSHAVASRRCRCRRLPGRAELPRSRQSAEEARARCAFFDARLSALLKARPRRPASQIEARTDRGRDRAGRPTPLLLAQGTSAAWPARIHRRAAGHSCGRSATTMSAEGRRCSAILQKKYPCRR